MSTFILFKVSIGAKYTLRTDNKAKLSVIWIGEHSPDLLGQKARDPRYADPKQTNKRHTFWLGIETSLTSQMYTYW